MVIKQRILMDEAYLKEYSLLPTNYSIDEIWNFIPIAEQLHIVPLIGQDMYNELLDQVEKNEVTPENASLLLQIYPFEGLAIMEVAMPYIAFHITETGITKGKSENSESVSTNDINYITNYVRSQMKPYKEKLEKFIHSNKELYPLIPDSEPCCKQQTNNNRVYGFRPINTDVDYNKMDYNNFSGNIMDYLWGCKK